MKLFVWDFHGVLESGTEDTVFEISNQVLEDFGYPERFTRPENHNLFGRKWYEYYEYLLPTENHERHMSLQQASFEMSDSRPDLMEKHIRPTDHAHHVLAAIAARHRQIIISNTKPSSLELFVKAARMTDFFDPSNAFAVDMHQCDSVRSKPDVLRDYLSSISVDKVVTIGDSAADMLLTQPPQGIRYLYSHPDRTHKQAEAEYRISDLREVLREV